MLKMNIDLGEKSYPIYITTDYSGIGKCLNTAGIAGKVIVITDSNVDGHQSHGFIRELEASGHETEKYIINAGEASKNLDTIRDIYSYLLSIKADRNATLIALGGGVAGDITGFAAATYLRGINFVQVPTSLLAQSDSSVGGKVGVDFEGSKNLIGAFYQPKFVYINVNSLKTLPERELKSGLAEVIKHGIIRDRDFFEYIDYNIKKILKCDEEVLQYITKVNCSIKGSVVEKDEKESGLRAILNFGHTIGHAVESFYNFELLHGECVSIGMVGACKLAYYLDMLDENTLNTISGVLKKAGLPVNISNADVDKIFDQMFFDKKIKNNKLQFILPKGIGEVVQRPVDDTELVKKVLYELAGE